MAIKLSVVSAPVTLMVSSTPVSVGVGVANVVYVSSEEYTGYYDIIPSTYDVQTLETENKLLSDNVTIQRIPQFEVSNVSGGATLIIGEEYYNV